MNNKLISREERLQEKINKGIKADTVRDFTEEYLADKKEQALKRLCNAKEANETFVAKGALEMITTMQKELDRIIDDGFRAADKLSGNDEN